uniref:metal-dependent transcriptional regulator n=1 Tax=Lachnoclostridium phocaeense TaxID=1871021 RepID=UPI0026DBC614|nr:metal-dependent transcriptional regulator [Lachnoclostridium phocaeense]
MELGQSLEDYLEAAYRLSKNQDVRNIDIALLLGRSKPSVSVAVKELMEKGYAKKDSRGNIILTEKGRKMAEKVYGRHLYYTKLLIAAGVDRERAEYEGCRMEHILSDDSHEKLKKFIGPL